MLYIARMCRLSDKFMLRIRHNLTVHGRVLSPSDVTGGADADRGADSHIFNRVSSFYFAAAADRGAYALALQLRSLVPRIHRHDGQKECHLALFCSPPAHTKAPL